MYVWVFHLSPSLLIILQNQLNKVVFAHLYNITILISRFTTCQLDPIDADGALRQILVPLTGEGIGNPKIMIPFLVDIE